jgi:hypothetical protein
VVNLGRGRVRIRTFLVGAWEPAVVAVAMSAAHVLWRWYKQGMGACNKRDTFIYSEHDLHMHSGHSGGATSGRSLVTVVAVARIWQSGQIARASASGRLGIDVKYRMSDRGLIMSIFVQFFGLPQKQGALLLLDCTIHYTTVPYSSGDARAWSSAPIRRPHRPDPGSKKLCMWSASLRPRETAGGGRSTSGIFELCSSAAQYSCSRASTSAQRYPSCKPPQPQLRD